MNKKLKIILLFITLLLLTSCKQEEYETVLSFCIPSNNNYEVFDILEKIQSKIDSSYILKDCKIQGYGRTDIISCLGNHYYSIKCRKYQGGK